MGCTLVSEGKAFTKCHVRSELWVCLSRYFPECCLCDQHVKVLYSGYMQQCKGSSGISEGPSVATSLNVFQNLLLIQFSWGIAREVLFPPLVFLLIAVVGGGEQLE